MDWTALKKIIAEAEAAAYQRGWDDAVKHILEVASKPVQPTQPQLPLPRANGHAGAPPLIELVYSLVRAGPGQRGTTLVDLMLERHPGKNRKSMDRTVRTALLRLKAREQRGVENREGRWYPKEGA